MLEVLGVVRALIAEGTAAGEFRADRPGAHPPDAGRRDGVPERDRCRSATALLPLGPPFSLPEPTTDIARFINLMLLDGLAAERRPEDR